MKIILVPHAIKTICFDCNEYNQFSDTYALYFFGNQNQIVKNDSNFFTYYVTNQYKKYIEEMNI